MKNIETKQIIYALLITVVFLGTGMFLLEEGLFGYGISFFVFLPFLIGFVLGGATIKKASLMGLALGLIIFSALLFIGKLEGMVCVLMAMPIIAVCIVLGFLVKKVFDNLREVSGSNNKIKASVAPLVLLVFTGVVEHNLTINDKNLVSIESTIKLPYSPLEVYEVIKSVDTLDVPKTFLMQLDLPVPQKCVLDKEEVGGIRTCYFEGGIIKQEVIALEKGRLMQMKVLEYQLTGRKWLGFKDAIYTFDPLPSGHCKMTRITSYTSELYPRFYWQPLEKLGIEQEHDYVFRNIVKDLQNL